MRVQGKSIPLSKLIYLAVYYGVAQYLPQSHKFGNFGGFVRYHVCKRIFKKCGHHVNIERKAHFASGIDIEIGNYSGIGINAQIPNGTIIGDYVMMGPNCFILGINHEISDLTRPMCQQGMTEKRVTRIGNDVWIGRDVHMTPGRTIADGSVIAMGAVLTKDFPPYSIVGGNPARLIRSRE